MKINTVVCIICVIKYEKILKYPLSNKGIMNESRKKTETFDI